VVDTTVMLTVGAGTVGEVQFAARDASGLGEVETLYLHEHAGTVFTSDRSSTEVEATVLEHRLAVGELSSEQHQNAVDQLVGGGAVEVKAVAGAASCGGVCVSGRIQWTDVAGGVHPVRRAPVEIRDDEAFPLPDDVVTTVTTDEDGYYSAEVDNDDGLFQGGRDVFIRVKAEGPGFTFDKHIDSTVSDDLATGTSLSLSLTARNDDEDQRAFSIQAGLVWGLDYVQQVRGSRFEDFSLEFPSDGSYYEGGTLNIDDDDPFDWDVVLHEYGHYIQDRLGIDDSPGGFHYWDSHLAETGQPDTAYSKQDGTRIAWGEGWATFFAVSGLQQVGAAASGVPHVGDDTYDDRTLADERKIVQSIEVPTTKAGEDNEVTTADVMYDLLDGPSGAEPRDHAQFTDEQLWNTIDSANPGTLSAAYQALKSLGENEVNCVFSLNGVAPDITGDEREIIGKDAPPPTISWIAGGGGPAFRNDSFVVRFSDADGSDTLLESPAQAATTFTPTAAEWKDVINVTVAGTQTDSPQTGPYTSCRKRFLFRSVDLAFVVDTTGSMWDDIAAVKAAATDITNLLLQGDVDARIAVVDYKDAGDVYQSRVDIGFTNDAASVVGAINSLSASGGGDTPESVYSGAMTALGLGFRADVDKKAIIIMGDAPAHDPEPVTGYTSSSVLDAASAGGIDASLAPAEDAAAVSSRLAARMAPSRGVPVSIYSVVIGGDSSARESLDALAAGSGGSTFEVPTAAEVVSAILDSIDEIINLPVAVPGGPYSGYVGSPVVFDGSASFDPDGTLTTYEWDFDDDGAFDASSATPTATHTFDSPYVGDVVLRVTDDSGKVVTGRAAVNVVAVSGITALSRIVAVRDSLRAAARTKVWAAVAVSTLGCAVHRGHWMDDDHLRRGSGNLGFICLELTDAVLAGGGAESKPSRVELASAAQRIAGLQIEGARPTVSAGRLAAARAAKAKGDILLSRGNTGAALVAFHTAWMASS
jgi:hypothetical protein